MNCGEMLKIQKQDKIHTDSFHLKLKKNLKFCSEKNIQYRVV